MARPINLAAYGEPDAAALAAAYAFGIARNHPFIDGNKRTAAVVSETFLTLNGFRLDAEDAELVVQFLALAAGETTEDELAAWFRNGSPARRRSPCRPDPWRCGLSASRARGRRRCGACRRDRRRSRQWRGSPPVRRSCRRSDHGAEHAHFGAAVAILGVEGVSDEAAIAGRSASQPESPDLRLELADRGGDQGRAGDGGMNPRRSAGCEIIPSVEHQIGAVEHRRDISRAEATARASKRTSD